MNEIPSPQSERDQSTRHYRLAFWPVQVALVVVVALLMIWQMIVWLRYPLTGMVVIQLGNLAVFGGCGLFVYSAIIWRTRLEVSSRGLVYRTPWRSLSATWQQIRGQRQVMFGVAYLEVVNGRMEQTNIAWLDPTNWLGRDHGRIPIGTWQWEDWTDIARELELRRSLNKGS